MGRLEKQIIVGALALVGVLLAVVVFKGLKPRGGEAADAPPLIIQVPIDDATTRVQEPVISTDSGWPVDLEPKKDRTVIDPDAGKVRVIDLEGDDAVEGIVPTPPAADDVLVKPMPAVDRPRSYTIQAGDTLSEIAQRELGSSKPRFVDAIRELNPGTTAENIRPGDVLILPASVTAQDAAQSKRTASAAASQVRTHSIQSGDSLWKLARHYYGDNNAEKNIERIVAANPEQLKDKHQVLKIGWVLVIPE